MLARNFKKRTSTQYIFFFINFVQVKSYRGLKLERSYFQDFKSTKQIVDFSTLITQLYTRPLNATLKYENKTFSDGYSIPVRFQVETKTSTALKQIFSAFRIRYKKYDCVKTEKNITFCLFHPFSNCAVTGQTCTPCSTNNYTNKIIELNVNFYFITCLCTQEIIRYSTRYLVVL